MVIDQARIRITGQYAALMLLVLGLISNDLWAQPSLAPIGPHPAKIQSSFSEQATTTSDFTITEQDLRYQASASNYMDKKLQPFRSKPGLALLSSAILPGSGQAMNKKWWRAGLYLAVEAVTLGLHLHYQDQAARQEQAYMRYADNNWSVVNYAKWLVDYNNHHNGTTLPYSIVGENLDEGPAYDTSVDWQRVNLSALRDLERQTVYYYSDGTQGQTFSHVLPDYGSQQYYELISKYFQYGSGWNDFGTTRSGDPITSPFRLPWDGSAMPANFFLGASKAETFNDNYRRAGNLITLLLANHIASAIDAFFTVKLANQSDDNQHTIDPSISFSPGTQFSLKYHF
ncbi:MAG: DUF5683 domain-containing protein [Bacteroidota bacterium]